MAAGGGLDANILSDETFDKVCIICKRKNKNSEAEKFCIDCQDYYCLKCVKVHEDVPLLNDHEILDKDRFPTMPSSNIPQALTEPCERLKHKHVDMYCENHDVVGCSTCMAVDHGSCKDRVYISEYSNKDVTTSSLEEELKSVEKMLDENETFFQHSKECLLKEKSKLLGVIKELREKINTRLDELEKNVLDEIDDEFKGLIEEAEKQLNLLQICKDNVTSSLKKLQSSSLNVQKRFVYYKTGKQIAKNLDEQLVGIVTNKQNITVEFVPAPEIQALLERMNIFGKVNQKHHKDSLLQVRGEMEKSIRVKTDTEECNIVSACVVEDGTIILSDRNNKSLKRLAEPTFDVTETYHLSASPWQVCVINNNNIGVCLSSAKQIEFVTVENKMAKSNEIKTDFNCYRISYTCDSLYVSDSFTSVYVFNLSGIQLKQFIKDYSGKNLFSDIRHLTAHKSLVYVTDSKKGLIVLDTNGVCTGRIDGPKVESAFGCYVTANNNLLIYDKGSRHVLQYGKNGNYVGKIFKPSYTYKNAFSNQLTICCNKKMTKLLLSGQNDILQVYDIITE